MKSIGKKIVWVMILMTLVSMFILGLLASNLNYNSTMEMVKLDFNETADVSADRISWELTAYTNIAKEMGTMNELSDPNVSTEEKLSYLQSRTDNYGLQRCNLVDINGDGIDGNNYSDRAYFQNALKGHTYISSPLVSKVTGKITVIVAAPLWKNGISGGESVGCVYIVPDEEFLNEIVRDINVSENGAAYIIDKTGATIADVTGNAVKDGENISEMAKDTANADRGYGDLAVIHKSMLSGNSGFDQYKLDGEDYFIGYSSISGTDGWSLAIYAPSDDFLDDTMRGIIITIVVIVLSIAVSAVLAVRLGTGIGKAIRLCTERIETLAKGDLKSDVPQNSYNDERGRLSQAATIMVQNLNDIINDIGRILEALAHGDLTVNVNENKKLYIGDYEELLSFMQTIDKELVKTISQINDSADQVTSGSEQVSSGAQALSQGATEQASEIEQLAARVHTISDEVENTAANCDEASKLADETITYMNTATGEMTRLNEAMTTISKTSGHIENIIMTIEDIAFQTNILALNAAVEASRAGEAGKGFAVVADEVRNLASKSAEAAKNTTALIQKSLDAVKNGTKIAKSTSDALTMVEERASSVDEIVKTIAEASENQAQMIEQIRTGMEQISNVVQTNSATAEESAAASEELSGQSAILKELIGTFRLH
ncbi:MAG: methyl-accepting chemotaxis protein [Oscillospiraceae bacterium]|nr:methyl-accepting chemotaxis protein [Oscillospiraceae bacterium]